MKNLRRRGDTRQATAAPEKERTNTSAGRVDCSLCRNLTGFIALLLRARVEFYERDWPDSHQDLAFILQFRHRVRLPCPSCDWSASRSTLPSACAAKARTTFSASHLAFRRICAGQLGAAVRNIRVELGATLAHVDVTPNLARFRFFFRRERARVLAIPWRR